MRAIEPRPSHLTCQWLCARLIRCTTITDVFCLYRYVSEGDDAGAASEDDDDDAAEEEEEEVEEEDDAEAAARKSLARLHNMRISSNDHANSSQSQEAQDRGAGRGS